MSESVRAGLLRKYGPPEVLDLGSVAVPAHGEDQVLVRVHATSVNPVDCYLRRGALRRFAGLSFPVVPGVDLSGVVESCGQAVTQLSPGDLVFGFLERGYGAYAEYAVCEPAWLALKPEGLSHRDAGAIPCVGLTALQGLRDHARLRAGQHVLIIGASGGVGTMAVQIANLLGAEVTGVCSARNIELVRSLGAAHVVDYVTQDLASLGTGTFAAVLDCVGARSHSYYRRLLGRHGRHVGLSGSRRRRLESMVTWLVPGHTSVQFHVRANSDDLRQLASWLQEGRLKPIVTQEYALSELSAAHRMCETRRTVGKSVILIGEEMPAGSWYD